MMSIGLHPRFVGQAGRTSGLREFIEYAQQKGRCGLRAGSILPTGGSSITRSFPQSERCHSGNRGKAVCVTANATCISQGF